MSRFPLKFLRLGVVLSIILIAAGALAQVEWLGIYLQGQKIGFNYSKTSETRLDGKIVSLTESKMEIGTQMLGSSMRILVDSSVWAEKGKLLRSYYKMSSGGRTLEVNATYSDKQVIASMLSESGEEQRVLEIPAGKQVVTDAIELIESGKFPKPGEVVSALVFSPDTLDLVEVTYQVLEPEEIETKLGKVKAQVLFVDDPRAPSTFYLSSKGDLIKMVGPLGIEMIPESEEEAKKFTGEARVDLAAASRVTPDKTVQWSDPQVELEFQGLNLEKMPSDDRQQVKKSGDIWLVTLGKDRLPNGVTTIAKAKSEQPEWVKPDIRVPADDAEMLKLANEIVGSEKTVVGAVKKVHAFVFESMGVNAGIGVMRDAREILKSKEGVCRDHAILAGTLLRAAGVPTRFANGLVLYNGSYYYHAWVEYWDGEAWIGLDTTRPDLRLGSGYIKTTQGTVGQALKGFLLEGAKIKVIGR